MNNTTQKNKSRKPLYHKLKNNAIIRMLFENNDLLSAKDILAKYSNNQQDTENSKIAKELQASLASIDTNVSTKQKRDELEKYKLSGTQKTNINKSRSTNTKTISSNSKSHDDERSI